MKRLIMGLLLAVFLSVLPGCNNPGTNVPKYPEYDFSLYEGKFLTVREKSREYGLGEYIYTYVSLEKPYDYYIDQGHTGTHGFNNCIPASLVMAARWKDEPFDRSVESIRDHYHPRGGWFYAQDAMDFLEVSNIPYALLSYDHVDQIVDAINQNSVVFVILDMSKISFNDTMTQRTGAFYRNVTGHGLIIQGYVESDQGLYFEVYDPFTLFRLNEDLTPKGKNRFYASEEIHEAIVTWYNKLFVIYA